MKAGHFSAKIPGQFSAEINSGWAARVNRYYLGRNWLRKPEKAMSGVVFFEDWPSHHAHAVVAPPVGASFLHFELYAPFWFEPYPARELVRFYPRPLHPRGKMFIQRIGPTREDLERTAKYNAKRIERHSDATAEWKMLRDLSLR